MGLLSVIVPCYNEEENVSLFYETLMENQSYYTGKDITLEILYVDDGSKDGTMQVIRELRAKDERVTCALGLLFQEFRKGSCHVRRVGECRRRLCGDNGCGSSGSAVAVAGDAFLFGTGV